MILYGYEKENDNMLELSEVSIISNVTDLRKLVKFFEETIKQSENNIENNDMIHFHMRDWDKDWKEDDSDLIIVHKKD